MVIQNHQEYINILRSLFKGREDVFAVRWEKPAHPSGGGNKSGYMPAVFYDPYRFRAHKMNGGTFQNFTEKSYLKLTDEQIQMHLEGFHHIGIYPSHHTGVSTFTITHILSISFGVHELRFAQANAQTNPESFR